MDFRPAFRGEWANDVRAIEATPKSHSVLRIISAYAMALRSAEEVGFSRQQTAREPANKAAEASRSR
jgi:hypothetical protein